MNQKMISSSLTVSLSVEVDFRGMPPMLIGCKVGPELLKSPPGGTKLQGEFLKNVLLSRYIL
jgi:hypothetical protein